MTRDEEGNFVVGDMVLSPEQFDYEFGDDPSVNSGIAGERFRWPGGVVPYQFERGICKQFCAIFLLYYRRQLSTIFIHLQRLRSGRQ